MNGNRGVVKRRRPVSPVRSMANIQHRWGPRFPKSCLHEFYQVHGGQPTFVIEDGPGPPASPKFTCHLTIPAVSTPHGSFEEARFTAWARSKKTAEHAAAAKALEWIESRGLIQPPVNAALAPPAPIGSAPPADVPLSEVRLLQQRLRTLTMQLAAKSGLDAEGNPLASGSEAMDEGESADVDSLSDEQLRAELKKAQEVNARLRMELALERERRKAAMDALSSDT